MVRHLCATGLPSLSQTLKQLAEIAADDFLERLQRNGRSGIEN